MKRIALVLVLAGLWFGTARPVPAEIQVITTDTNLADIAKRVGGNLVHVESLSRGTDDPHAVEPRPSMVVKVAHADVFARIGMDLDMWADPILDKAGNAKILKGGKGYADCSARLRVLEVPTGKLDPSMGDIHVYGNPHYLLDPANGILAAGNIAAALIRVDPAHQPEYHQRFLAFGNEIKDHLARWQAALAPYRGREVVVYHKTWAYFMDRFGFKEAAAIEPRPGLAPSPGHVNDLVNKMKAEGIHTVLVESFRSDRFPNLIVEKTGAKVAKVPIAVDAEPGVDTYFKLFDTIVSRFAAALK
jgi:ABC-type Zn uptake system ZnuABC Zn-binding protein ZnuA